MKSITSVLATDLRKRKRKGEEARICKDVITRHSGPSLTQSCLGVEYADSTQVHNEKKKYAFVDLNNVYWGVNPKIIISSILVHKRESPKTSKHP